MNQQSEFEPGQPLLAEEWPVNRDPHEQGQYQQEPNEAYQAGYATTMGERMNSEQGQKIYPHPPRQHQRRRWRGLRIAAASVFILIFLLGGLSYFNHMGISQSDTFPGRIFKVSTMPKITVTAETGGVRFHTDTNNNNIVTVVATQIDTGLFGKTQIVNVNATQDANANTINIHEQKTSSISTNTYVDLDITLPANSDIQASLNSGAITIDGVSGAMNLKDNSGTIDIENSTLTGTSNIRENAGDVIFRGSITNAGDYTFENNGGPIDLALPANSAFTLDSKDDIGKVNNEFGSNTVGTNPTSQIHVKDHTGTITIHKQ